MVENVVCESNSQLILAGVSALTTVEFYWFKREKNLSLFSYHNGCFKVVQFLLRVLLSKISLPLRLVNSRFQGVTIISEGQGKLYKHSLLGGETKGICNNRTFYSGKEITSKI